MRVGFSPDGKTILAVVEAKNFAFGEGDSTRVRLWPAPARDADAPTERLALGVQVLTGLEMDADGAMQVPDPDMWKQRRQRLKEMGGPPAP